MKTGAEDFVKMLLNSAGINVNEPHDADMQVKYPDFYERVLRDGSLGLGEVVHGWLVGCKENG